MTPARYDIVCPQGSTLSKTMTWSIDDVPVNLTGYSAALQVKDKTNTGPALIDLESAASGPPSVSCIILGGSAGTIRIYITAADTNIAAKNYIYDLELYSGSEVYRLIEGRFVVTAGVTQ